jgi:lipopolysaccharide export system permease protein
MSVLARYVVHEQLRLLAITLGGLAAIHFAVGLVDELRGFLTRGVPIGSVGQYFALGIPRILEEVTPFALLIATVLGVGGLSGRSEVVAMRAAGFSVSRMAAPLLGVGLAASLLWGGAGLSFVPRANALADRVLATAQTGGSAMFLKDSVWFRAGRDTIYGIRTADPQAGVMWGVRILETDGSGGVVRLTTARRMVYRDGRWELKDGRVVQGGPDAPTMRPFDTRPSPLARPPEALGEVAVRHEALSYKHLKRYADRLKADGYDATRYQVELAGRLAFPFASLVMVLVAIPHGLVRPRARGLARGVGVSLLVAVAYWLLHSLSMALGKAGVLPPMAAAWVPVAVFAAYGMYRLLSIRQ